MPRIVPSLAALLLCSTALSGCETVGSVTPFGEKTTATDKKALEKQVQEAAPADLAGGVRQAHELRLAGKYDEASRVLSQLMLVASDDPRVVGEYGKTLLQRGRSQDAVQFLSRAVQIQSNDWTTYSALGVAYDQLSDQASARGAYEHALAMQPREASVLSNYALSRMLANDLDGARVLAARAESAGGSADPKIARTIAMIVAAAPQQPVASESAPVSPVASAAPAQPVQKTVASAAPAPVHVAPESSSVSTAAPRVLAPAATASNTLPAGTQPVSGVVMQAVPLDPLAGPVRSAQAAPAKSVASATTVHHAVKAVPVKHNGIKPAFPVLRAPEAVAKTNIAKPEAAKADIAEIDAAKTDAKPTIGKTAVIAQTAPAADKIKAGAPVKAVALVAPTKPGDKIATPTKTVAEIVPAKVGVDKAETVKAASATAPAKPGGKVAAPVKAVATVAPVKPVADKAEPVKAASATVPAKPGDKVAAPVKAVATVTPVKPVADKAEPVKAASATVPAKPGDKVAAPVKAVATVAPVKAATALAKGQAVADKTPAAVKAVASKQDGVPALRLAADASTP